MRIAPPLDEKERRARCKSAAKALRKWQRADKARSTKAIASGVDRGERRWLASLAISLQIFGIKDGSHEPLMEPVSTRRHELRVTKVLQLRGLW